MFELVSTHFHITESNILNMDPHPTERSVGCSNLTTISGWNLSPSVPDVRCHEDHLLFPPPGRKTLVHWEVSTEDASN